MAKLNKGILGILVLSFVFIFISCESEDSNPTSTKTVNYSGLNSMNKNVLFTIIDDKVVSFSIGFEIASETGVFSGTRAQSNSKGFATIESNSFTINLETNEVIKGDIAGGYITGSFLLQTGRTVNGKPETVNGTFTVQEL
jgi:hypothetical protein